MKKIVKILWSLFWVEKACPKFHEPQTQEHQQIIISSFFIWGKIKPWFKQVLWIPVTLIIFPFQILWWNILRSLLSFEQHFPYWKMAFEEWERAHDVNKIFQYKGLKMRTIFSGVEVQLKIPKLITRNLLKSYNFENWEHKFKQSDKWRVFISKVAWLRRAFITIFLFS